MQSVDTTMLYIALPAIAEVFHQPVLHMELIVISYVVTVVAFTPVNGWMAERLGERNTYLVAVAIFYDRLATVRDCDVYRQSERISFYARDRRCVNAADNQNHYFEDHARCHETLIPQPHYPAGVTGYHDWSGAGEFDGQYGVVASDFCA
ncbi:hypothetical protein DZS_49350 [Dickeya ananatis]